MIKSANQFTAEGKTGELIHDIKNSLTVVKINLEMLSEAVRGKKAAEGEKYIQKISKRLEKVVSDMDAFVKEMPGVRK